FGNVPLNSTVEHTITLTVDGGYRTQIASGGANPPFQFDFDTCGASGGFTGPGTCTVKESFTPTSTGPAGDMLRVFECPIAGGGCIDFVIPLQGNGVSDTAADPPSVDFGNVPLNTTAERTISLTVDSGYRTEVASRGLHAPLHFHFD